MLLKYIQRRLFSNGKESTLYRYKELIKDLTQTVKFDSQNRIANIPDTPFKIDPSLDHAPKRTHTLNKENVDLAIKNHLKYFTNDLHAQLDPIFRKELEQYGHIYMFNYLPRVFPEALPFEMIPGKTIEARAMQHMILNNLDPKVAQFP